MEPQPPPADGSPLPTQRGDAGIRPERCSVELQAQLRKLTHRAGTVGVQIESPRLTLDRLPSRERSAHQQGDVDATRIARRVVAQYLAVGGACRLGQRLAR